MYHIVGYLNIYVIHDSYMYFTINNITKHSEQTNNNYN